MGLFSLAGFVAYFFLSGFIFGAGFQPTPTEAIEKAAQTLRLRGGMVVYDLGSGLGKVLFHLSKKYEVKCVGVEIDPLKFVLSSLIARIKKLEDKVQFIRGNILDFDLSNADVVFLFLSSETGIMEKIASKALVEMKAGSKLVSYIHEFDKGSGVFLEQSIGGNIHVYSVPLREVITLNR